MKRILTLAASSTIFSESSDRAEVFGASRRDRDFVFEPHDVYVRMVCVPITAARPREAGYHCGTTGRGQR